MSLTSSPHWKWSWVSASHRKCNESYLLSTQKVSWVLPPVHTESDHESQLLSTQKVSWVLPSLHTKSVKSLTSSTRRKCHESHLLSTQKMSWISPLLHTESAVSLTSFPHRKCHESHLLSTQKVSWVLKLIRLLPLIWWLAVRPDVRPVATFAVYWASNIQNHFSNRHNDLIT